MPELIEVETYRRQAEAVVGRTVAAAPTLDPFGLRHDDPAQVRALVVGSTVTAVERIGKLLLVETDGPVIGLRFGMTGRLIVDGAASIDRLEYGGTGDNPAWDRFVLVFDDDSELRIRDPRRLGGLQLDPDTTRLGPDATELTPDLLATALTPSTAPVKARMLDQGRIAGLGNLLTDESLWRAGINPARPAGSLESAEIHALATAIAGTLELCTERGGSHTGDLQPERFRGGTCPVDASPLQRRKIGGRTTYSCPAHQR